MSGILSAFDGIRSIIAKARRFKEILDNMATAKENRIRELVGLPPLEPWWEQYKEAVCETIRACLCRTFCPCCIDLPELGEFCCPKGSILYRLCTVGQYPHEVLKSFGFFLLGLLLSIGLFCFFSLQLEVNMEFALAVAIVSGFVLSVGLAFFHVVRCLVFLALPSFCSSKGRSFLIMYTMVLIMNHPVQDFSHNLEVLSDAATCGQSMAINETKQLMEAAASPLLHIKSAISVMLEYITRLTNALQLGFAALQRAVEEIIGMIGKVFEWLTNMTNVCNDKMGKPYRKCKKCFEDGYRRCRRKLWLFKFLCSVVRLVRKVCIIAKFNQLLCVILDAVKNLVLEQVGPPVMTKINDIKEMFYFNVTMNYHFEYNMNQSRPYSEVREAILTEIKMKLNVVHVVQAVVDNIMCFTVLLVVLNAVLYRSRYLKKDGYDNCYVTKRLLEIDARRMQMGKDQTFPLTGWETFKYIETFSYFMTAKELKKLIKGLLFWLFAVFNASYYIVCDYGLYWILDLVRRHMDFKTSAAVPPHVQLHVQGGGPMADMYRAMVGVVEPVADEGLDVDTATCLPNPKVPNFFVYKMVAILLAVTFLLTILSAYALRLQHIVANIYYPHRERARAVWLFNNIIITRDRFLVFTRKQVARKYKNEKDIEQFSFLSRFAATSKIFRSIMKCIGRDRKYCLSCGREGPASDTVNFTHCFNCKSPYCNECFLWLQNVCTACMNPMDYGDVDGVSVEEDSSEEEVDKRIRVAALKDRKQKIKTKKANQKFDREQMMLNFQKRFTVPEDQIQKLAQAEAGQTESSANNVYYYDGESSSSYDTDYQHRSAGSSSENEQAALMAERRKMQKKRKKVERVTIDIFGDFR